jgi:Cys/Met metabolism PLP-dependent enzyme
LRHPRIIVPRPGWSIPARSVPVGFEVRGGKPAAFRCLNALKLARISNNLGDAKTLVTHPATTTHQRLTPEDRAELGISEGFIRLSAGLEHPADLIDDLQRALELSLRRRDAGAHPELAITSGGRSARAPAH